MILGFKDRFVEKIISGEKIHTIREDKNQRWAPGKKIHFATGVRTPNYHQFMKGECKGVEKIYINPEGRTIMFDYSGISIFYKGEDCIHVMGNDGFDSADDFWNWFDKPFSGVIIHWTDFKYFYF